MPEPDSPAVVAETRAAIAAEAAALLVTHDPLPPPPVAEAPRARPSTSSPPIEEIDEGWDLGDDDPTATTDAAQAAASADNEMARPEPDIPSSSDMAGDGSTGGDGIDEPGWD